PDAIRRLLTYHFVMVSSTPGTDGLLDPVHYGNRPTNTNIVNPQSNQLSRLLNASQKAPTRCAEYQLLGEYLHAFEDTFAHRDADNRPYAILVSFR
ncbi:MAG TPA: hypothetical protein VJN66_06360, partial [Rhodanobacteraceae bacterium]|nr:hypothetical protein [Rhodanobacteraceae bacterium]